MSLSGLFVNTEGPPSGDFFDLSQQNWMQTFSHLLYGLVDPLRSPSPVIEKRVGAFLIRRLPFAFPFFLSSSRSHGRSISQRVLSGTGFALYPSKHYRFRRHSDRKSTRIRRTHGKQIWKAWQPHFYSLSCRIYFRRIRSPCSTFFLHEKLSR